MILCLRCLHLSYEERYVQRAVTKTYNVTSRYVLQTKFFSKPMEGSAVTQGVGFTPVGLRLGSEETDSVWTSY